jgi:type IV secretory pathway VirB3-like protein
MVVFVVDDTLMMKLVLVGLYCVYKLIDGTDPNRDFRSYANQGIVWYKSCATKSHYLSVKG